jgi:tRNA (guanine-N7-)-methyltransferase
MRHRNTKGAFEMVEKHEKVIKDPRAYKGKWRELFGNNHEIHIEVGMGKGRFLTTHARNNQEINYIGIEKITGILYKALSKISEADVENLLVVRIDANELEEIFDENEVDKLYLNFSDPWPKDRQGKRRLTHKRFLKIYETILKDGSQIEFKTDNDGLFEFSLEEMKAYGLSIDDIQRDLHGNKSILGNVMTEYEQKFSDKGITINRLIATVKK